MYITYDQLCQMSDNLSRMYDSVKDENQKATYKIMIATIEGMIQWIEERVAAEMQDGKCICGKDHTAGPDPRSN